MISHANIMWTLRSSASVVDVREGERFLSFLPLSHIAERMISDFLPVAVGGDTWFARSLATVAEDLRDCHPTVFFAVPRVWEKFQEGALAKLGEEHGLKKLVVDSYVELGEHVVGEHDDSGARAVCGRSCPTKRSTRSWERRSAGSSASTRPISWSPRRRRSTPTSSAGSTPSDCPSSSSTARPRSAGRPLAVRPTTTGSVPSGRRSLACECASPTTARSSSRAATCAWATSGTRPVPPS